MLHYIADAKSTSHSLYFLREPIFWYPLRILTFIFGDFLAFLVIDLFCFLLIYKTFQKFHLPQFSFFSFLSFFPVLLGFQNMYRQHIAILVFLLVLSYLSDRTDRKLKTWFYWIFSSLIHNSSAIFGFLILSRKRFFFGRSVYVISLLLIPIVFILFKNSKSGREIGSDFSFIYSLLLLTIIILFLGLDKFKIRKPHFFFYTVLLSFCFLSFNSFLILESSASERISYSIFYCLYPLILSRIEGKFQSSPLLRMFIIIIGFIPIYFVDARLFLS